MPRGFRIVRMNSKTALLAALQFTLIGTAAANGVTPYLPLNLAPEVEREVERVLILGDKPVMTRPIPAALVLEALPKACTIDAPLCERVRTYLGRYMHATGVEFASAAGSASSGHSDVAIPNDHGTTEKDHYQLAGAGYVQLADHLLVNVGGVANQDRVTPTGSVLSLGFDFAQLDIGWRDRWWSPMTDSSMLISTEAPTMPSFTLSNYRPLTRLGLQYEIFLARLSKSDRIELTNGTLTSGYPKFAGLHLSMQPTSGWSLGVSRIVVFGGGAAGGQSFTNILQAFFNPSKAQSTGFGTEDVIGKQEASVTSRFIFPGRVPFSVYFEYAGNDTSDGNNFLLGKPDMSMGIAFPRVGPLDVTLESSYWAPTWYVHGFSSVQTGYGDGITNYFYSTGHWFGDQRQFGDAVGGRSAMLRVGWEPSSLGGRVEAQLRMLTNDSIYSAIAYRHEYMGSVSYSYPWREYAVGGEIDAGRDVFGAHYTRLQGFLRFGDALSRSGAGSAEDSSGSGAQRADGAELFVDVGVNANNISERITSLTGPEQTPTSAGPHLGIGARREVSEHQDLGVRLEADDVQGHALYSFRALDYRYRFNGPIALSAFAGASRYDLATSAFGFSLGTGVQWRNVLPNWDLGLDYRYGVKVARLRTLPSDPQGGFRPDSFYDIQTLNLYVTRKF
jgi:Capsule assembly protein Wzi